MPLVYHVMLLVYHVEWKQNIYAVLTLWCESSNHFSNCYFCMTDIQGYSKKFKHNIDNASLNYVSKPKSYYEDISPPWHAKKNKTE